MAKKDGSISILTVEQLAKLVPPNTKIYFIQAEGYVPACEEEITWDIGRGIVLLNKGEDDAG